MRAYLLNKTAKKLFPRKKVQKTVFKLSIIFQIFDYIRNNTGIVGVRVPAVTVGVPDIM